MFGVVYYTSAGKYEDKEYKKISLMNIIVKFDNILEYCNCDYNMNTELKPFFNDFINLRIKLPPSQSNNRWTVDDVIARRSFFIWKDEHNSQPYIDVTRVKFQKAPNFYLQNLDDAKFYDLVKQIRRPSLVF